MRHLGMLTRTLVVFVTWASEALIVDKVLNTVIFLWSITKVHQFDAVLVECPSGAGNLSVWRYYNSLLAS